MSIIGCKQRPRAEAFSATFAFAKTDFDGRPRTAEEVHAMALANLQGEYATVISANEALAALRAPPAASA